MSAPAAAVSAPAAAVVLAAGLGSRFGETPKLIAPLAEKAILQHVLDALRAGEIAPVVVVLGHAVDQVRPAIEWHDEIQVLNRHPERGILRSVLLGLRRLDETWSVPARTLIVLGDQPRLSGEQIDALLAEPVDEERPYVVPRYADGSAANPVLLEASGRALVQQFVFHTRKDADRGLAQFFATVPDRVRQVDVPGTNPDIDTVEDLDRLRDAQSRGAT